MAEHIVGRPARRYRLLAVLVAALFALLFVFPPNMPQVAYADAEPAPRRPVTVSLTYDDGTTDQLQAATIMARYGMKGTFYINSSRLGAPGRLTKDEVHALQDNGHEIGGHSVTHADLPTLDVDEQRRQVCNDRKTLLGNGFHVTNFAYPYGDDSAETQQVVASCGYNSGRVVGDIVSPGSCYGCPYAEKIPPTNPYGVKTPDSIKPASTLEQMQNYVLQAEQSTGGWVVIVMHRVCENCDPYAVTPAKLDGFLSWLVERAAGGTVVRTVAGVIGGPVRPAVDGPPPAPRAEVAEMLTNPSMDIDTSGDGVPNCWQRGGYGDNSWTWSNAASPHSGPGAMQVKIANFVNGDRRIMSPQDLGACAPITVVGHTYQVSGWYRSDGTNRMVAYYRDTTNRWNYLGQGPPLTASPTTWKQTSWTPPVMPPGSSALAVGISLRSVGTTAGDDFSVMDTDQVAPSAALTSPIDGSRLRGTATFTADAADASGVDHVDFLVDGEKRCTATEAPYRCQVDTTVNPDTVIAVTAKAVDTAGNITHSEGRNYTVSNSVSPDGVAPTVALTSPLANVTVSGNVTLNAAASDDDAISRVLYYLGDTLIGAARTAPYTLVWNSQTAPEGAVQLQAKALDLSGNLGSGSTVSVTVDNYSQDTVAPVTTATCGGDPCTADWSATAVPVSLRATDAVSGVARIAYTIDGTDPTDSNGTQYSEPFAVSSSATVKYRAWDRAGNVEAVASFGLKVDTQAPTARISAPVQSAPVTGVTYIKADVADANGIARVYFYLDGKLLGSRVAAPYQWRWDAGQVPAGTHALQVIATDPAGNRTKSETVSVAVS
jgi:peptidoglycan/xylan/chitin deacetylase (PgdA/CDA1 family)